jgi:hypothetical protein
MSHQENEICFRQSLQMSSIPKIDIQNTSSSSSFPTCLTAIADMGWGALPIVSIGEAFYTADVDKKLGCHPHARAGQ